MKFEFLKEFSGKRRCRTLENREDCMNNLSESFFERFPKIKVQIFDICF